MWRKLLAMAVAAACLSLLVGALGCGGSKPDPKQTVNDFWNAIKSKNYQKAFSYMAASVDVSELKRGLENPEPGTEKMVDALFAKINMVPVSSKVEGDNATVPTEVTMPNVDKLMEQIFEIMGQLMESGMDISSLTEEQITDMLMGNMEAILKDLPTVTKTTDIKLVWENGAWKIKTNPFEDIQKAFENMGG